MIWEFIPLYFAVENLIAQGLTLLASPPKFGKSWLALMLSLNISQGDDFLGYKTNQSRVLYLALEDSTLRIKKRLTKLLNGENAPENIDFSTSANTLDTGLINDLEDYLRKNPDVKLIIIDTLQKVRSVKGKSDNAYAVDYRELGMLKSFADMHEICVVVIHHLRKQKDNDVFNKISGTNAIMGAADTILVIEKDDRLANQAKLHITGRDVECDELCIDFNPTTCQWHCEGNAKVQELMKAKREYLEDPIMIKVRKFIKKDTNAWKGTATELLNELKTYFNTDIIIGPETLSKKLRKYKDQMQEFDYIFYTPPSKNGSNGFRIHTFEGGGGYIDDYSHYFD